jgi:hypothetical protein
MLVPPVPPDSHNRLTVAHLEISRGVFGEDFYPGSLILYLRWNRWNRVVSIDFLEIH